MRILQVRRFSECASSTLPTALVRPTFAIKRDGTLWAWGDIESREVGFDDSSDVPTQVGSDSDWVTVVASAASFAIKRDGTLWAWGNNEWGNLGLGDRDDRDTPTQVGHDCDWA